MKTTSTLKLRGITNNKDDDDDDNNNNNDYADD